MKEILTRNLGLKIISVVIAFFVWLAVVNVSDPLQTIPRDIPLDVVNEQVLTKAGLTYELENKRTKVTVAYQIYSRDVSSVTSADFRAYIDLADYYPATGTVPVYVEVLNNKDYLIESVTAKPAVVRIKTEQIQKKDFDLQANTLDAVAAGYEVSNIQLEPSLVTVEGPESLIGQISSVGVEIPLDGISSETAGTAVPVFYDANGNKLTNLGDRVTVNAEEINYRVGVMKVKEMALEFEVGGSPADGYRYIGLESSADSVAVMGAESVVAGVDTIRIPAAALDISGATEDRKITVNVEDYLPDKANMSIPWNSQVTVTLKVEQTELRTLRIPSSRIIREGALDDLHYKLEPDFIEVTAEGLKADVDHLDASDIIMEMDVSDMAPGIYAGRLTFDGLPDGVEVNGYSNFQVVVTSRDIGPGITSPAETGETESSSATEESSSTEETESVSQQAG
ncbi:MAG: CdaR family protein [Lachnospiraceae bacterium]|nr:CdaR family protein [Lachnospiraceae bacterium]